MEFQAPETGAENALLHNNIALTNISYLFQGCTNIVSFLSIPGYWGYGAYDTLTKLILLYSSTFLRLLASKIFLFYTKNSGPLRGKELITNVRRKP